MNNLQTKKGDIAIFTVLILAMVMMALLFNISIKTNSDLRTSRDTNLSQQAYNKALKGTEAWIDCASDPNEGVDDGFGNIDVTNLTSCDLVESGLCELEISNGVTSICTVTYDGVDSITSTAYSTNTSTGEKVDRVIEVKFSKDPPPTP